MSTIEHIINPDRLLLLWIPSEGHRMNRIVGELIREGNNASLRYLCGNDDFEKAREEGFAGYPYLPLKKDKYENILDIFLKRLPPKSRDDYSLYLDSIRLPSSDEMNIDEFTLLGYSGAKLPDDDFSLVHTFENAERPFELLMDVAGARYHEGKKHYDDIVPGEAVTFELEPDNEYDSDAIAVYYQNLKIGYVCRGILSQFHEWMHSDYIINATTEKKNGTRENPKFYIFVRVT